MSASALQGRVFDRWRHAQTLAPELQADAQTVRAFLASDEGKKDVFTTKPGAAGGKTRPVTTAPGKTLLAAVQKKLEEVKGKDDTNVTPEYARKVADALVLGGFITPMKDAGTILEGYAFDSDVFVAVGADIAADSDTKTVWAVRDGAIQAGKLKRKRTGFFAKLTGAKALSYVVANETSKALYVFESDTSRVAPVVTLNLAGASVEFTSVIEHGVKITSGSVTEVFGAESKEKAEEWLNAIINAGATYREAFNVDTEAVQSIYELKDFDMGGKEVSMDTYRGKVLLIVNVSSNCGLTPTNYPEFAELDRKYRDQGLQVLAFPCNQFGNQEPGTHEEIMEFVKQYKCEFPFFEKHDVNGAHARPVFTYLKAKLPGLFGSYIKWNFTKFLVDRNGQPYKRYAPKDLPFSFEEDIKALLAQKCTDAGAPVADKPAADAPAVDAPAVDAPAADAPAADTPAAESEAATTNTEAPADVASSNDDTAAASVLAEGEEKPAEMTANVDKKDGE